MVVLNATERPGKRSAKGHRFHYLVFKRKLSVEGWQEDPVCKWEMKETSIEYSWEVSSKKKRNIVWEVRLKKRFLREKTKHIHKERKASLKNTKDPKRRKETD